MSSVLPESPRDEYAWDMYDPRNPLNKRRREKGAGDALKKKDKLKCPPETVLSVLLCNNICPRLQMPGWSARRALGSRWLGRRSSVARVLEQEVSFTDISRS